MQKIVTDMSPGYWGSGDVNLSMVGDIKDDIGNYFYDLPNTMKRCDRYVAPLGNGMHIVYLPDLHNLQQADLHVSPASFIYPWELTTNVTFSGC